MPRQLVRVRRWGNSHALVIPVKMTDRMKLKHGDPVCISLVRSTLVVRRVRLPRNVEVR